MRPHRLIAMLLVLTPLCGYGQNRKKHSVVSAAFQNARYVYVEAEDGGDITKPGLFPEDREAISNMQEALRRWNRYALAIRKDQADLVFIVRKGRIAGALGHGGISEDSGPAPPTPPRPGQSPNADTLGVGTEVGPVDDSLQVFTSSANGKLVGPIWAREIKDGLDGPRVLLLQQLKDAVEQAYPNPPAQKKP
jgi:hypothetical protein